MTLSLLLRRASVFCAALLIASVAAAQGEAKKVLRYAFPIAETGFDTVQLSDLYSRTICAGIFDTCLEYEFLGRPYRMRTVTLEAMPEVSEQAVRELAQVFKLLSDETRLRILFYLAQNSELHVTDLCNRLGQSQPAVSHHLALLRVSGLIESRREGKHNFYSVRTDHFGELLVSLFTATGEMPRKIRFHDFVLTYSGE